MSDRIQVSARVRRRSPTESATNSPMVVTTANDFFSASEPYVMIQPSTSTTGRDSGDSGKVYTLDQVYGPNADQRLIYDKVARPLFDDFVNGINVTILAYGLTGSGKTYTMLGEMDGDHAGIVPRVLLDIFREIGDADFRVKLSCVELYKEELRDLISDELELSGGNKPKLRLVGDTTTKNATMIQNLHELDITDANAGFALLQRCLAKRKTLSTKLNARSSRSHTIFTVHLFKQTGPSQFRVSKMNLVDLAGSEDIIKSGATDLGAREAGSINQSLLTLGKVINALSEGKEPRHVPYRESKLTRLLQGSIGGRTKTALIATVSPAKLNVLETMSTLNYASKAKNIRNLPQSCADSDVVLKKTKVKEMSAEICRLHRDLLASKGKDNSIRISVQNYDAVNRRVAELTTDVRERDTEIAGLKAKLAAKDEELESANGTLASVQEQCLKFQQDNETRAKEAYAMRQELLLIRDKYSSQRERVSLVTGHGVQGILHEINNMVDHVRQLTKVLLAVKEIPGSVREALDAAQRKLHSRFDHFSAQLTHELDSLDRTLIESLDLGKLDAAAGQMDFSDDLERMDAAGGAFSEFLSSSHLRPDSPLARKFIDSMQDAINSAHETMKAEALRQIAAGLDRCLETAANDSISNIKTNTMEYMQDQLKKVSEANLASQQTVSVASESITEKATDARRCLGEFRAAVPDCARGAAGQTKEKCLHAATTVFSDISEAMGATLNKVHSQATVDADTANKLIESTSLTLAQGLGKTEHSLKIFDASLSELQRSPAQWKRPASSPATRLPLRLPLRVINGGRSPETKKRRTDPLCRSPLAHTEPLSRIPSLHPHTNE